MYIAEDVAKVVADMNLPFTPVPLQLADSLTAANEGRFGFLYEVGGGKTLVSTIVAKLWKCKHNIIICPPILLLQWRDWLKSIGETSVEIYANGIGQKGKRSVEQLQATWVIMSHAIFRDDFKIVESTYRGGNINLIVDEAQALKNPRSVLFKDVNLLVQPDRPLILCTATPTSKPEDTYAYMKLKTPALYRSMTHWEGLHVESRDFWGAVEAYKNMELLADNFAIATVTRSKKDLFGDTLTPIMYPVPYQLAPAHIKLYNRLAEERLLQLPDGQKIDATEAQRLRHMMQQIIVNYARFSGKETDVSNTFDLIEQTLDEVQPMLEGHSKLAIWTYYQSSSALITTWLKAKYGEEAVVAAYGATNSQFAVQQIMTNPNCRIMVAQPSSVGAGLNLQHVCHEMLFVEVATTPMLTKQAIGRVDRAGQKVRPTIRFGQAVGTVQLGLYNRLFENDDLVGRVERTGRSLREEILGVA